MRNRTAHGSTAFTWRKRLHLELLGLRSPGLNSATPATEKARAQAMFWPGDRSCLDRQTPDGFPSLNVQLPDHVYLSTLQKTEEPEDDEDNIKTLSVSTVRHCCKQPHHTTLVCQGLLNRSWRRWPPLFSGVVRDKKTLPSGGSNLLSIHSPANFPEKNDPPTAETLAAARRDWWARRQRSS